MKIYKGVSFPKQLLTLGADLGVSSAASHAVLVKLGVAPSLMTETSPVWS